MRVFVCRFSCLPCEVWLMVGGFVWFEISFLFPLLTGKSWTTLVAHSTNLLSRVFSLSLSLASTHFYDGKTIFAREMRRWNENFFSFQDCNFVIPEQRRSIDEILFSKRFAEILASDACHGIYFFLRWIQTIFGVECLAKHFSFSLSSHLFHSKSDDKRW